MISFAGKKISGPESSVMELYGSHMVRAILITNSTFILSGYAQVRGYIALESMVDARGERWKHYLYAEKLFLSLK